MGCFNRADFDYDCQMPYPNIIKLGRHQPVEKIESYSAQTDFPRKVYFPIELLDSYHAVYNVLPILTSKRCYWSKCDFCAISAGWGTKHKRRSVDDVIEELTFHANNGIRYFRIVDEDLHPTVFERLVNKLILADLGIRIEAYQPF